MSFNFNQVWRGRPLLPPEIYVAVRAEAMMAIVKEDDQTMRWDAPQQMNVGMGVYFPDIIFTENASVTNSRWVIVECSYIGIVWTTRAARLRSQVLVFDPLMIRYSDPTPLTLTDPMLTRNEDSDFELARRRSIGMPGSRWEIRQVKKVRPTVFSPLLFALRGVENSWLAHTRHQVHTDNCVYCEERRATTVERVRRFNWPTIIGGKNGNRT